jgi:hypothetical protein
MPVFCPTEQAISAKEKFDFGKDKIFFSVFNLIPTVHGVVFALSFVASLTRRKRQEPAAPTAGSISVIPAPRRAK